MSSSIDTILHIVVFAAIFSSSSSFVVNSATGNYPNGLTPGRIDFRIIYNSIQVSNYYYQLDAVNVYLNVCLNYY